jgi:methylmalonyl-CoA mutase cobalamin-binding subunit
MDEPSSGGHGGYSIRVVARMTGIPADTLRMWERRYGFPKPQRTNTGIRAYTAEDLERLQLVVRALAAGHRPGQVVPMPRGQLEKVLSETADAIPSSIPLERTAPTGPANVSAVVEALSRSDILTVHRAIRTAAATLGARAFLAEFAHPLVVTVGQMWHDGQIDVRHEHLVTDALVTQIRVLLSTYEDLRGSPSFLLASLPDEEHTIGTQMTALFLSLEGARVHLLGTAAPPREIVRAAHDLDVDVVGLSLVRQAQPSELNPHVQWILDELPRRVEVWLGGAAQRSVTLEHPGLRRFDRWDDMRPHLDRMRRH